MTWRWMLITAIAPITWGSTYVVTHALLPADYPLWGSLWRALPAAVVLLIVARRLPRGSWWWKSLVLGVLNIGAFFVLVYLAAQLLPSSIASTVMATSAGVILFLAWPLLRQRPQLLSLAGAVIGFVGVAVMLLPGADAAIDPWGVVASLAAMLSSSVGFLLARRWNGDLPLLATTAWQLAAGALLLAPVAFVVEGPPPALEAPAIAGFAYVSLIATGVAYLAWFTGLRHLPAGTVGVIGLLNPVTGVLLGTLLVGETLLPFQVVGIALVIAGVLIGQLAAASRAPAADPA